MKKLAVLVPTAIVFVALTFFLLKEVTERSVSLAYCSEELQRLSLREKVMFQLLRSAEMRIGKDEILAAIKKNGLERESFEKGPSELVVHDVIFRFDELGHIREISRE
ncbi:MAG TPA: hypothetical protein VIV60_16710 [Polyangiaceae bacterium]